MRRSEFTVAMAAGAMSLSVGRAGLAAPSPVSSGTSRNIRVRLFSGRSLIRADVTGNSSVGSSSLFSFDANTTFKPTVIGGGVPLTVTGYDADGLIASRVYGGTVTVSRDPEGGILIVNTVDLEAYAASVLAAEISPSWAFESLKAQAIAIRTYALRAAARTKKTYDVADDTSSQVYPGLESVTDKMVSAAQATAGLVLYAGSSLAEVFYSAACGGHTASSVELTGATAPPHLRGIRDLDGSGNAYCAKAPYFAWQNVIPGGSLERIFDLEPGELTDIDGSVTWPDGRVRSLKARSRRGFENVMDGHVFYGRAGAMLGNKVVPSTMFKVTPDSGGFRFAGHGIGHGVGMCQWGARGRANAGLDAASILGAYFPGTTTRLA